MGQKLAELKTLLNDIYTIVAEDRYGVYNLDHKPTSIKDLHDTLLEVTDLKRKTPQTLGDYVAGIVICARYISSTDDNYDEPVIDGDNTLSDAYEMLRSPNTYVCDGCGEEKLWFKGLLCDHDKFCCESCDQCAYCGDVYRLEDLTDGICYSCIENGYFSCGNCGEWFYSESELMEHELNCDFWETCSECGQDLYGEDEWSHIESGYCPEVMPDWLKDGSEPGWCDICGCWVDELPVHNWDEH